MTVQNIERKRCLAQIHDVLGITLVEDANELSALCKSTLSLWDIDQPLTVAW